VPADHHHHSSSSSQAAVEINSFLLVWQLLQEAARHCVASKMHTHWGSATQSFASLEKLLQRALSALQQQQQQQAALGDSSARPAAAGAPAAAAAGAALSVHPPPLKEAVLLLLDFMWCLECEVLVASEGVTSRLSPKGSSLVFFTANKRVSAVRQLILPCSGCCS
jgi:hypothetical protein